MSRVPELQRLARSAADEPGAALVRVLRLLCEQLGCETALLGRLAGGEHVVDLAVTLPRGRVTALEGTATEIERTGA